MSQHYSNPKRASDPHALPDVEVFYIDRKEANRIDADNLRNEDPRVIQGGGVVGQKTGWFYWFCFPGCLPDGDPIGPFDSEALAVADAQANSDDDSDSSDDDSAENESATVDTDAAAAMVRYASLFDLSGAHGAFSAACALYWYCNDYHGGQDSDLYALQSQLDYRPGMAENGPEPDTVDVDIYRALETKELEPRAVFDWIIAELKAAKDAEAKDDDA